MKEYTLKYTNMGVNGFIYTTIRANSRLEAKQKVLQEDMLACNIKVV